jgi:hypothetical protein
MNARPGFVAGPTRSLAHYLEQLEVMRDVIAKTE